MIETEIGDGEFTALLQGMNWDYLRNKKPEFIARMVLKKIKVKGWAVKGLRDRKQIIIYPVTTFSEDDAKQGESIFVYEVFRDWKGELLSKKGNNCKVRIRRDDASSWVTTIILEKDLKYEQARMS